MVLPRSHGRRKNLGTRLQHDIACEQTLFWGAAREGKLGAGGREGKRLLRSSPHYPKGLFITASHFITWIRYNHQNCVGAVLYQLRNNPYKKNHNHTKGKITN